MRLPLLVAALSALPFSVPALELPPVRYPTLPAQAATAEGFVPPGWTLERRIEGDLDRDGRPDLVLVLRQHAAGNIVEHDGLGLSPYDSNPRLLAIAWSRPSGYVLAAQNHTLIPRPQSPTDSDVLDEGGGVWIQRGALRVALYSWSSAGSWSMGTTTFTFRWQDNDFALIGYDRQSIMRNSGESEALSVNFATGKAKISHGSTDSDREQVRWQALPGRQRWTLQSVGDGGLFNPLPGND